MDFGFKLVMQQRVPRAFCIGKKSITKPFFLSKMSLPWECDITKGRAEWTSNHQCTSWPFYPLDGVHFFFQCQMEFIIVHFFLLLTTVPFCFFFWFLDIFPLDLTYHPAHFPTFLSITPTLLPYLSSLTDIATLIINYPIYLTT